MAHEVTGHGEAVSGETSVASSPVVETSESTASPVEAQSRPVPPGYEVIYRRWITRKGVRIYPPKGQKAWRLMVKAGNEKPATIH